MFPKSQIAMVSEHNDDRAKKDRMVGKERFNNWKEFFFQGSIVSLSSRQFTTEVGNRAEIVRQFVQSSKEDPWYFEEWKHWVDIH